MQSQQRMGARARLAGSGRAKLHHNSPCYILVRRKLEQDPTLRSSVSVEPVVYGAHSSRQMRSAFPRRQANSRQTTPRNWHHTVDSDTLQRYTPFVWPKTHYHYTLHLRSRVRSGPFVNGHSYDKCNSDDAGRFVCSTGILVGQ